MRWIRESQPGSQFSHYFLRAMIITLAGNIILAGVKIAASYLSGSAAIYADAINSISDVLYSLLLVGGFFLTLRPPDLTHPQGHSRFEPFLALIVTLSMTIAGAEALRASVARYLEGGSAIQPGIPMIALSLSVVIKGLMYHFIREIGQRISSPGLNAAASDNLSDVLTSFAAMIGIFGSNFLTPLLDPLAGIFVAVWIFKTVWSTAKENLGYLTGAGADDDLRQRILDSVKHLDGVEDVHHVIADYIGPKLLVEMHINVDGDITLNQAHAICDQATAELEKIPEVDRAYVHVEPIGHS